MVLRVLGVHGVWNYRPRLSVEAAVRALTEEWAAALSTIAPSGAIDMRVAYYAHLLRTAVPQGGGPDGLTGLPADVQDMIFCWAKELGVVPVTAAQGPATVPIRWLVDRVAAACSLSPALTVSLRRFVGMFFREVAAYLREPDNAARRAARDCVAEAISEHRPDVLVAHSLGTVVAYEALLAHSQLSIPLLITLGSPLGMPAVVYERLLPAQLPSRGLRPPNVARWVNVADPGDVIAIPRPFTRRFAPDENHEDEYINIVDFHLVGHYLQAPATVRAILSMLP
jgi:hypothetical protein